MGTPLRRHEKIFLLLAGIGFITLATYSCQKNPPADTNPIANGSPAPAVLPPWPQGFPQAMPSPAITGNIPRQVVITGNPSAPQDARPFFDNFSWESFIALNWPAVSGSRGVPNPGARGWPSKSSASSGGSVPLAVAASSTMEPSSGRNAASRAVEDAQPSIADASENRSGGVGGRIVNHHDLVFRSELSQGRADGLLDESNAIADRHDHAGAHDHDPLR